MAASFNILFIDGGALFAVTSRFLQIGQCGRLVLQFSQQSEHNRWSQDVIIGVVNSILHIGHVSS